MGLCKRGTLDDHRQTGVQLSLEGLVDGSEPADVGAGGEENEPQDSHAKVSGPAPATHPRQAANQIHGQCGAVH